MAIYLKWPMCPCHEPLVTQIPINRVTLVSGQFDPIKQRNLPTEYITSQTAIPSNKLWNLTHLSGVCCASEQSNLLMCPKVNKQAYINKTKNRTLTNTA